LHQIFLDPTKGDKGQDEGEKKKSKIKGEKCGARRWNVWV